MNWPLLGQAFLLALAYAAGGVLIGLFWIFLGRRR